MKINYDINDKIALVTGANRGIGKAIVDALVSKGATKVYAAVRNLNSAIPLVKRYGSKVVPVELDLAKPETITATAETSNDVQVVINNAGIFIASTPMARDAIDLLELGMKINVFGLIRVAQAFAPVLKIN